jgi:hypothetical protein
MTKHLPHLLSALLAGLSYVECQYFSMGICPAKLWVTENVTHCFSCSGSLDLSTTDILLDNPLLERPRQQNQHVPLDLDLLFTNCHSCFLKTHSLLDFLPHNQLRLNCLRLNTYLAHICGSLPSSPGGYIRTVQPVESFKAQMLTKIKNSEP